MTLQQLEYVVALPKMIDVEQSYVFSSGKSYRLRGQTPIAKAKSQSDEPTRTARIQKKRHLPLGRCRCVERSHFNRAIAID